MKNQILFYVLTFTFLFFQKSVLCQGFVENNTSFSYDQCTGTLKVEFPLQRGTCGVNAELIFIEILEDLPNGGGTNQVFAFEWGGIDVNSTSSICDGPFIQPTNFTGCRGYRRCGILENNMPELNTNDGHYYYTAVITYLNNDFFGNATTLKIKASWEGGGEETFSASEATQFNVGTPTLTSISTNDCDIRKVDWTNSKGSVSCDDNKLWTVVERRPKGTPITSFEEVERIQFPDSEWDDTHGSPGEEFDYRVRHLFRPNTSRMNYSGYSEIRTGNKKAGGNAPILPMITSDQCDDRVDLSFNVGQDVNSVRIYRNGNPTPIGTSTTSTFTDNNPADGVSNTYRISAINDCGIESPQSDPISITLASGVAAPSNVQAVVNGGHIDVTWDDDSDNEAGFVVERTFPGGGGALLINLPANTETYTDMDANICVTYTYTVKATTNCGGGGIGNASASARINPDLSTALSNLRISKGFYSNRVELSWDLSGNAIINRIKIERRVLGSGEPFTQIASENSGTEVYLDNNTDANILYEYQIFGESQCESNTVISNSLSGVGFRSKIGQVSGRVSYTGGIAVKGVKILAESTNTVQSKTMKLNGAGASIVIPQQGAPFFSDEFLAEGWFQPSVGLFSGPFSFFNNSSAFDLSYDGARDIVLSVDGGAYNVTLPIDTLDEGEWTHIGAQLKGDTLAIVVNGRVLSSAVLPNTFVLNSNFNPLIIGDSFDGLVKEVRVWKEGKDSTELVQDYGRFMIGIEPNISVYLPLTEGVGDYGYDRSRSGQLFNRNHGQIFTGQWTDDAPPTSTQLGYFAITDSSGTYILSLPFKNEQENYELTPQFLSHSFNPPNHLVIISDGNSVLNRDFEDVSSFRVTGSVFYENTTCAVEGAFLKIDGVNAIRNGNAVRTDDKGEYELEVPIGRHFISVEVPGHTFSVGRFPDTSTYDFQEPLNLDPFLDGTLRKVAGRVVGGLRESRKLTGLGHGKNNIGVAQIIFKTQDGCHIDTVYTVDTSGEYSIDLPPLKYIPEVKIPSNPTISFPLNVVDYTLPVQTRVSTDSLTDETFEYDFQEDFIYRVDPIISVTQSDGIRKFIGDTLFTTTDPNTGDEISKNLWTDPFKWPVFANVDEDFLYRCMIKVYERYQNLDDLNNILVDSVPTIDGELKFDNEMADVPVNSLQLNEVNTPDTLRSLVYSFKLGSPQSSHIANQSISDYSYTSKLIIELELPNGQVIPWHPITNPPFGGDNVYRAYVLTSKTDGAQYVTNGPERIDFILRDPPGSNSSATRSVGRGTSNQNSWSWNLGGAAHTKEQLTVGAKFVTGFGVAIETDIKNSAQAAYQATVTGGRSGKFTSTISNTEAWSTSSAARRPGAPSDVFVGTSQNVQFGMTETLTFVPTNKCGEVECMGPDQGGFRAATLYGLSIVPGSYETGFILPQYDIKTITIPKLYELRNAILQSESKYVNVLPISNPNYGKNNDDPDFGAAAVGGGQNVGFEVLSGPSYTYLAVNEEDSIIGDKVRDINIQIKLWEEALALNEWEKVNIDNQVAIDSLRDLELEELREEYLGTIAAYATLTAGEGASAIPLAYGLIANPVPGTATAGYAAFAVTTALSIGSAEVTQRFSEYEAKKARIEARFDMTVATNRTIGSGTSYSSSITQSQASSNTESLEYSLDAALNLTAEGKISNNGIKLEKGLKLQFKRGRNWGSTESSSEKIGFTISDNDVGNTFSVDIFPSILGYGPIFKRKAGGQTSCPYEGETVTEYYEPNTVIAEATLEIDKPTISSSQIKQTNIPSDEPAVFNLTIGNATESDLARTYEVEVVSASNPFGAFVRIDGLATTSVRIPAGTSINKVLTIEKGPGSVYQYDSLEVIVYPACQKSKQEKIYLSAHFLPTCSDVSLNSPEDLWVLNNSFKDTMPVVLSDYNLNTFDLELIRLEYKSADESRWVGIQDFYKDTTTTTTRDPSKTYLSDVTEFTLYDWEVDMIGDGVYDVRAVSVCENAEQPSVTHRGFMDRINPHAFGSPSPADGILDPNDEISIKFNELVDIGSISQFNFDVRGVTNGTDIRHQESMAFDGMNDFAQIAEYNLSKRSFTVEYWARRNSLGKQIIFSQGLGASHQINIGFDTDNRAYFQLGDKILKSNNAVTNTQDWFHYAIIFDKESNTAEIIVDSQLGRDSNTSNTFSIDFTGAGPMILGQSSAGTPYRYNGFLHELRIWSVARSGSEITTELNRTLSGRELGLIGCWPMDEAWGTVAHDKVRGRHAQMSGATWSVKPNGNAYHFNESQEYLVADNGFDLAFTEETDLTFEFWFKGNNGSNNMSVFSNGKADGTANQGVWDIFFNPSGHLVIQNDGHEVKTNSDHLDNNWHHFAAVISRLGNVLLYIDGELVESELANPFKEFGGTKLWVGCRGFFMNGSEMRDQYFNGYLDDIRIWNLARTSQQIQRDFVNALSGDEPGLEAYYPFDNYIFIQGAPEPNPTLEDKSESETNFNLTQGSGSTSYSNQTAPIKLPRPVKKVKITYSINQDEIIIQLNEDPHVVENVTLDITVKDIEDLAGNKMVPNETWIAYIDKNQVFWNEEYMEFEKQEGDPLSFEATVLNTGGSSQSYVVGNLPTWLSASPSAGVIDPNSSLKVTFTVDPLMDIGEFTQDIFVTGDFGFNEKLVVDITNTAIPPDWTVNANEFQYSMNITGALSINDVISIDEGDMVSAYINGELVGVSNVQYFDQQGIGLVFLTINSHSLSGDKITFNVWDASEGRLLVDVTPSDIIFNDGAVMGSGADPVDINALALAQLTYDIAPGWNWISFPINGESLNDIDILFGNLPLNVGDQFESLSEFTSRDLDNEWAGNLTDVNVKEGYKLYAAAGGSFEYEGIFEDPSIHPIDLNDGWTWVGMIAEQNLALTTALASLDPQNGDIIKSQKLFAVYDDFFGWVGNLNTLIPQEGYLIKLNGHTDQLIYPSSLNSARRALPASSESEVKAQMARQYVSNILELDEHQYSETMNMVIKVEDCLISGTSGEWYVVALSGGETRGVSAVSYENAMDSHMSYLTVYGSTDESIEYRLVKGDLSAQLMLEETETFAKNAVLGDPSAPYAFSCVYNESACPEERQLSTVDMKIAQQALRYRAQIKISTNAVVEGSTELYLHAGQQVDLLSGFEVKDNALLEVQMEDCPED